MPRIIWDKAGEHFYETGVDHGVLYPTLNGVYQTGVAWNGLTSVSESPSGAESTAQYADNIKYLNLISAEEFGATIEAFTYPPEFAVCDGSAEPVKGVMIGQQTRRPFGLCYRTLIGNDLAGTDYGYKLHLIYGATASPSERAYATVNDSPEAITFSWEVATTPVEVPGYKPTASLTIDSTQISATNMAKLEEILYGSADAEPRLPMPQEVIDLIGSSKTINLIVTPLGSTDTLLGKTGAELMENVQVGEKEITGKLLYVDDFTEYESSVPGLQEGNYLALEVATESGTGDINWELLGDTASTAGPHTPITANGGKKYALMRITNQVSQSVKIDVKDGKDTLVKTYTLSTMELATAASIG